MKEDANSSTQTSKAAEDKTPALWFRGNKVRGQGQHTTILNNIPQHSLMMCLKNMRTWFQFPPIAYLGKLTLPFSFILQYFKCKPFNVVKIVM